MKMKIHHNIWAQLHMICIDLKFDFQPKRKNNVVDYELTYHCQVCKRQLIVHIGQIIVKLWINTKLLDWSKKQKSWGLEARKLGFGYVPSRMWKETIINESWHFWWKCVKSTFISFPKHSFCGCEMHGWISKLVALDD
jgi:hypothetical protein